MKCLMPEATKSLSFLPPTSGYEQHLTAEDTVPTVDGHPTGTSRENEASAVKRVKL